MRRINLILLLLGMLMAVGIAGAQEEEILVSYTFCCASDNTPILAEAFMNDLQEQLVEFGIEIRVIQTQHNQISPENSVADFSFFEMFDGERIIRDTGVTIWTVYGNLEQISPILESELGITMQLGNDDTQKAAIAMVLYALGKNEEALDVIQDVDPFVELNPNVSGSTDTGVPHLLGNIHLALGDYDTAISLLESDELSWYAYGNFSSLANLAWLYITNGESEKAFDTLSQVMEAWPEWYARFYLLSKRAQIYAIAFDYDSAIADMDEAIALAEENEAENITLAELYTIRGQIIFLIYEWDRVLADFNHAIELDPNYAPAYFQRGVLYYTMTQRENALADFEYYLELEPNGLYAEEATQYIESIQTELEALGG